MITLLGPPVLSPIRTSTLISVLALSSLQVHTLYFLHLSPSATPPTADTLPPQLHDILQSRPFVPSPSPPPSVEGTSDGVTVRLYVYPRPGTISPFSSKATDILRSCSLLQRTGIERVERGELWELSFPPVKPPYKNLTPEEVSRDKDIVRRIHDRMIDSLSLSPPTEEELFSRPIAKQVVRLPTRPTREDLMNLNKELGLALSDGEIEYLVEEYGKRSAEEGGGPTDVELFTFSQINSEHCRHKTFNSHFLSPQTPHTLFQMIRNTSSSSPSGLISSYSDNAAVFSSPPLHQIPTFLAPNYSTHSFPKDEQPGILIKAETHNHPTSISPFPGSATGTGGEIRDEAAVGRGSRPKMGVVGYMVGSLNGREDRPSHVASGREIMIHAPLGASEYGNELGRPTVAGLFRTLDVPHDAEEGGRRGYGKPVMLAGGHGSVLPPNMFKHPPFKPGTLLVVLGGGGMLIGLGGGSGSSLGGGEGGEELDFKSVQRGNAEMERRAIEVIDRCSWLALSPSSSNPILSVHDVGAAGLSNAFPELVRDSGR
ncbi:PurM N-terminal domain-like protein [Atractiella rhizophila]|nr:PurM N-terminal domain-like protein [Atractiella rhizophila]